MFMYGIIMMSFIFRVAAVLSNFLLRERGLITHGPVTLENINNNKLFDLDLLYVYYTFYAHIRILRNAQGSKKSIYKFINELIVIHVA